MDTNIVVPIVLPEIGGATIDGITDSTVNVTGELVSDGGDSTTVKGFCWNITGEPTIEDSHIESNDTSATFTATLTGLDTCTTYYVRPYATNSIGTVYGTQQTFITGCPEIPTDTTVTPGDTTTAFDCQPFLNIHDTTVNLGSQVQLSVTDSTMGDIIWTWAGGTSNGSTLKVTPTTTTTYYASAIQYGPELIVNGDFEQGNVGFETEYTYGTANWNWGSYMMSDGYNHSSLNGNYMNLAPKSQSGLYYFSDSDEESGDNSPIFWKQNVQISPNTTYMWSFTAAEICQCNHIAVIGLYINGVKCDIGNQALKKGEWSDISYIWHNDSLTSVELSMRQTNTGYTDGNDFGIDDISFRAFAADSTICKDSVVITVNPLGEYAPCEGTPTVTDYDGNVYNTVQIGNQCWTKENLKTKHFADGTEITLFRDTVSTYVASLYYPNDDPNNLQKYGYLYNRMAWTDFAFTNDSVFFDFPNRGICPEGWHLPNYGELSQLHGYVSSSNQCGSNWNFKPLAAKMDWISSGDSCSLGSNLYDNDQTGFSALPAGGHYSAYYPPRLNDSKFGTHCNFANSGDFCYTLANFNAFWGRCCYLYEPAVVRCLRNENQNHIISTGQILQKSDTAALSGGSILLKYGNSDVTQKGLCWSTTENPTITDSYTNVGNGDRPFYSTISNLAPNTTYYVRSYAIINGETFYGNQISFTTICSLIPADITTDSLRLVSDNAIEMFATVTVIDEPVTEKGFCYSTTNQTPSYDNSNHISVTTPVNSFSAIVSDLEDGGYFIRSYAKSICGNNVFIVYGDTMSVLICNDTTTYGLACPGMPTVTDYDGNVYNTVQIGEQCWMKENLRTTHYANGTEINNGNITGQLSYDTAYYYYYPDKEITFFGRLYNWVAVMNGNTSTNANPSGVQGVCPNGWHVPSIAEYHQMTDFVKSVCVFWCGNNPDYIQKSLASPLEWAYYDWADECCVTGDTIRTDFNKIGFSAIPANVYNASFDYRYSWSSLTTCTESNQNNIQELLIDWSKDVSYRGDLDKKEGVVVRCVKD